MNKIVYKVRLKKGDTVMVRSGKYKGHTGKILQVYPALNKVKVEGVNVVKRHHKPTRANPQGGVLELTKPIWTGQLGVLDAGSSKPARIGYQLEKDGSKRRINKTSGREIK